MKWNEQEIIDFLKSRHYPRSQWVVFDKLKMGKGYRCGGNRFIDLFAFNKYPSKNFERVAYEIKLSRADFIRELRNIDKARWPIYFANQFYYVAPLGVIPKDKIPSPCGLIELEKDIDGNIYMYNGGKFKESVEPIWQDNAPNWAIIASLADRIIL